MFLDRTDRGHFYTVMTLGLQQRQDETIVTRSAAWLINAKGVAEDALGQRAALARDSSDPALARIADQLSEVRQQLSALTLTTPKPGETDRRLARLAAIAEQEQSLAKQLQQAGGAAVEADWVETATIREALKPGSRFIDIAKFQPAIFGSKPGEPSRRSAHYAAWITPPAGKGDVTIVDLGEAAPIDKAVAAFQAAIGKAQDAESIEKLGERAAEEQIQGKLKIIEGLVWEPLLPAIGDAKQIVFSADSNLWLVPFGALPIEEKGETKYALEKWNIRYVTSGRDLVGTKTAAVRKPGPPRIFANPDFDLPAKEIKSALASVFNPSGAPAKQGDVLVPDAMQLAGLDRARRSADTIGHADRLPGTAREAREITPSLEKFASQPKLYVDRQALEGVFKRLASPRVLVVSTHGFFLPDQTVKSDERVDQGLAENEARTSAPLDASGKPIENPLLRCGLLLAGCNNRQAISDTNLDDGILTGMEIVGTDLRSTELVVLSACETGLGQVSNGEGVAGLRQAFHLSGARAVVSTLWQIPDDETATLMKSFFANLAAGKSKADALRDAQLAMIASRRARHGAAHPFYWAAFTLNGE